MGDSGQSQQTPQSHRYVVKSTVRVVSATVTESQIATDTELIADNLFAIYS